MTMPGLVVDLFAGGGGASVGLEAALGRPVDIAINHDPVALAVHKANHPHTRHLEADIWEVRPLQATRGRPVDVLWASPDCTHFSVAKGGKPRAQNIRSLAWVVVRWARDVRPTLIFLENVAEFRGWGPLDAEGRPIKARMGETFHRWRRQLEKLGYQVDHRVLDASLFGAPTRRRRLFLVARCDGQPIAWPEPTHGPGRLPLHTAAECLDWSLPCRSIFERKRPLAEKTLWRIAQGIRRFVLENPRPFIVGVGGRAGQADPTPADAPVGTITAKNDRALVTPFVAKVNHGVGQRTGRREHREHSVREPLTTVTANGRGHALVAPTLVQTGYGEREGQAARVPGLDKPLGTVVAGGQKHALDASFLAKHFGGVVGQPVEQPASTITAKDHHGLAAATLVKLRGNNHGADPQEPMPTVSAQGNHIAEVRAFLTAYHASDYAGGYGQAVSEPTRTLTTKHRLGLVTVEGADYQIVDIGMRMLEPHELLAAQFGRFTAAFDLSAAATKTAKVQLIGNSVCPEVVVPLVRANPVRAIPVRRAA